MRYKSENSDPAEISCNCGFWYGTMKTHQTIVRFVFYWKDIKARMSFT